MANGKVIGIYTAPQSRADMHSRSEVTALKGCGLSGDRYATGNGSYSQNKVGNRQVTLINSRFFPDSGFAYGDCRRNLVIEGTELMWLIGRKFQIGEARMRGIEYCDPCPLPSVLANKSHNFKKTFEDCGGLIAEVIEDGVIRIGDALIPPPKGY